MWVRLYTFLLAATAFLALSSCNTSQTPSGDTWDRGAMLEQLTDDYILPAFQAYAISTDSLLSKAQQWENDPSASNLAALQSAFLLSYEDWQRISFIDVGPAESLAMRYRTNTYPADTAQLKADAASYDGTNLPNFTLPSTYSRQGFPALDFLLWQTDASVFTTQPLVRAYVVALTSGLAGLASTAHLEWQVTSAAFVANDGSSAAASTNKLANDFIYHVEKELRAGKVGIPAGVFSSNPYPGKVEAPFSGHSKALFQASLKAHQAFFNGESFDGLSSGPSFAAYLDHLGIQDAGKPLSDKINASFQAAESLAAPLPSNFDAAIQSDVYAVLDLYDELQRAVVLLKVDMMQAMNIKVDYVDADGD